MNQKFIFLEEKLETFSDLWKDDLNANTFILDIKFSKNNSNIFTSNSDYSYTKFK